MNCAFQHLPKLLCWGPGWTVQQQRRHVQMLPRACRCLQSVPGQMQSGGKIALPRSLCTLMVSRQWSLARSHRPSEACPHCQSRQRSQPPTAATSAATALSCQCCACSAPGKAQLGTDPVPAAGCRPHALVCSRACTAAAHGVCTSYASAAAASLPAASAPPVSK